MNVLPVEERPRGVAYAFIWTTQPDPVLPADLADALVARGFIPGFTNDAATDAPLSEAGLADARLAINGASYRIVSLSSSRGLGCRVAIQSSDESDLPDDYLARRAVRRPRLVYVLEAGGPGNSDRTLCENLAESLLMATSGVVQIGGLGTKGNRPVLHTTAWLGSIRK